MTASHFLSMLLLATVGKICEAWIPQGNSHAVSKSSALFGSNNKEDTATSEAKTSVVQEYKNAPTQILSNFMSKEEMNDEAPSVLDAIDFDSPIRVAPGTSLETLAAALDHDLIENEWFVTGRVNPIYFSDDFIFDDPDVKVDGIEDYARGVNKLFNQAESRAQIESTVVSGENKITCTWRLSGKINIAFGLPIKPYMIETDFVVDPETSLIISQEDRFALPSWDILISSLLPFTVGMITSPPAPPIEQRVVSKPKLKLTGGPSANSAQLPNPFDMLASFFQPQKT